MSKRLLITGSRYWADPVVIAGAVTATICDLNDADITIVTGGCPTGADRMAEAFVEGKGDWREGCSSFNALNLGITLTLEIHYADWAKHGPAAGPIRNQEMVDAGADICLAFPLDDSKGTIDCLRRTTEAGIPIELPGIHCSENSAARKGADLAARVLGIEAPCQKQRSPARCETSFS